jgi:cytochrome c-type protein NapB
MLKHSLMAMAALGLITLTATAGDKVIDINKGLNNPERIAKEDLGNKKKTYDETALLLNKKENAALPKVSYDRPAPGTAPKFERSYVNAPPLIPHSVDGLLPITKANNSCLGCHMPNVAKATGATPIPPSHFTNYRPDTVMKDGHEVKGGKIVGLGKGDLGNVGDIKLAKAKKLNHLYQGRYNCTQCHVPQSNVKPVVDNTFQPDFGKDKALKTKSDLINVMNEGVQ